MFWYRSVVVVALLWLLLLAPPVIAGGGNVAKFDEIPFFDFTDEYYLANGVDPSFIPNRVQAGTPIAKVDTSPDPDFFRNVRVTLTIPGWAHNGDPVYISVFGEFGSQAFTNNAAGVQARQIADQYPLYIFPCAHLADKTVLPPTCKRQNDIIPLNNGYFSNDPLGLWLLIFVVYKPEAFNTAAGQAALQDLEDKNGLDLDGTPLVKTLSELEHLKQEGLVDFLLRPENDQRWSVCPALKDPRGGAVAADSFLAAAVDTTTGEAAPGEVELLCEWECLRDTGDWCEHDCAL